jgi:hypothetical protein
MPVERPASYLILQIVLTMVLSRSGRIMAMIVILFLISAGSANSQCKRNGEHFGTASVKGIQNGPSHYFQNLIIQDLAIAAQKQFSDISILLDYEVKFISDRCRPGQLDIIVMPLKLQCRQILYEGYDISASLNPERASLVFHILQENGVVVDSLTFSGIKTTVDSGLYSLQSFRSGDVMPLHAVFVRAEFHYSKSSYEKFRNHLLAIDDYYAACMLADSAMFWASNGFLKESGNLADMSLSQIELARIIRHIGPGNFSQVFSFGQQDLNGLAQKYKEVAALNTRYNAIIAYNHLQAGNIGYTYLKDELLEAYLDRFDFYYGLSFRTDFRYVNFLQEMSQPELTATGLLRLYQEILKHRNIASNSRKFFAGMLATGLIERGKDYENSGNQLRALTYYRSALQLSDLLNLYAHKTVSKKSVSRMTEAIAVSYLEISKRGVETENPSIASQYYRDAMDLFASGNKIRNAPPWLTGHEKWMFANFEEQVIRNIQLKRYKKALDYLTEIELHSNSSVNYRCPGLFHDWMLQVREGIYFQLLNKANALLAEDEMMESEQVYRQAAEMRRNEGYRIEKDKTEAKLEVVFRQMYYDEFFDEGLRKFNNSEYVPALYYFNKAEYLENSGLVKAKPDLTDYRQESARKVIAVHLSDGRLKVWAHDYEGAANVLIHVKGMLDDYGFSRNDTLYLRYIDLKDNVLQSECREVLDSYQLLIQKVEAAESAGNYILAYKIAGEAVDLSMDNLKCRIGDEEAWFQKIRLETLAEYQEKVAELDRITEKSIEEYLSSFQELKQYYNRHKLLAQGVMFTPLFDRIILQEDSAFLTGMLHHYIFLDDYTHALKILHRMNELGFDHIPLKETQKRLAKELARRDQAKAGAEEPWEILNTYTEKEKFFKAFRSSYKKEWLKASNWNIKYWPFILKK